MGQTKGRCAAVTKDPLVCLAGNVEEVQVYGHPKVAGIGPQAGNHDSRLDFRKAVNLKRDVCFASPGFDDTRRWPTPESALDPKDRELTGYGMDVIDHATQIPDTATFWKRCGAATTERG